MKTFTILPATCLDGCFVSDPNKFSMYYYAGKNNDVLNVPANRIKFQDLPALVKKAVREVFALQSKRDGAGASMSVLSWKVCIDERSDALESALVRVFQWADDEGEFINSLDLKREVKSARELIAN